MSSTQLAPDTYVSNSASSKQQNVTISFDAGSQSYTISWDGRTSSYGASDGQSSTADTVYHRQSGSTDTWLTVQKRPYTPNEASRKYVNLAFAQRNERSSSGLALDVAFFAYGTQALAAQVPRSGVALYEADGIGLVTAPAQQPRSFQIEGSISFDFGQGEYSAILPIHEYSLGGLQGGGGFGGGVQIASAGRLTSNSANFSGSFALSGLLTGVSGTLSGSFYGSDASEAGATFFGTAADGSTASGSLTAALNKNYTGLPSNLINVPGSSFYSLGAYVEKSTFDGTPGFQVSYYSPGGTFSYLDGNLYRFGPGSSSLPMVTVGAANQTTSSNPNFTAYAKIEDDQDVRLKLYKVGSQNSELALTYSSFGEYWTVKNANPMHAETREFFVYGLPTDNGLLSLRTGNARYEGVIYGAALNKTQNGSYDVRGTSFFNVDFGADTMTGGMALRAVPLDGSPALVLGDVAFSGPIRYWGAGRQEAKFDTANIGGSMSWNFYGPTASEVAGSFEIVKNNDPTAGQTIVAGITVAKEK